MKKLNSLFLNQEKLQRISTVLAFLGYGLIVFSDMYNDISWLNMMLSIIDVLSIFLLILSFILNNISVKQTYSLTQILSFTFFLALTLITGVTANNRTLIKLPFLVLAFINIRDDNFIYFDFKCRGILLAMIMILTLLGLNGNTILEYRNGLMRNSFGMGHPNSFSFELSILYADIIYIYSKGKHFKKIVPTLCAIILIIFNIFFLGSRTNILLIIAFYLCYVIHNKITFKNKIVTLAAKNSFLICLTISLCGALLYRAGTSIGIELNKMLSQRLHLGDHFLAAYGIPLLGQDIDLWGSALDNAYLNLIIRFGSLLTFYFVVIHYYGIKELLQKHKIVIIIIIINILLYGLSESPIYAPGKNPFLLILACAFFSRNISIVKLKEVKTSQKGKREK